MSEQEKEDRKEAILRKFNDAVESTIATAVEQLTDLGFTDDEARTAAVDVLGAYCSVCYP